MRANASKKTPKDTQEELPGSVEVKPVAEGSKSEHDELVYKD